MHTLKVSMHLVIFGKKNISKHLGILKNILGLHWKTVKFVMKKSAKPIASNLLKMLAVTIHHFLRL